MYMQAQSTLNAYIQQSIITNWELPAMTDIHGANLLYKDVAVEVAKLHLLFRHSGVKRGDKIALCGKNSSKWAVTLIAVITYGAVAVPILNDFKPDTIHHLVKFSDARLLFTTATQWHNLDPELLPDLLGVIRMHDYSVLHSNSDKLTDSCSHINLLFGEHYPAKFGPDDVKYYIPKNPDELILINYTSGSSGFSKGVMLSSRNIWSNIQFCIDGLTFLKPQDGMVCMLPLAHMYGLVIEMLHTFVKGCHLYFVTRTPSPKIIMEAFALVKPKLVITVPLILEKIIKTRVFPQLDKPVMKILLRLPYIKGKIYDKIRRKLIDVFGGELKEVIIGGAPLNHEVEIFLRRIKFPFTVGYGMTECAPLVAYSPWRTQKIASCGKITDRMTARIRTENPESVPGVLEVKGDNVMLGYYKNTDATKEAFTDDGWLVTGDICTIDSDGYLYIRGRDKNMILGPSGQNIYPEEIEQKLNNKPLVMESLVIDDGGGNLAALIYPDIDSALSQGIEMSALEQMMHQTVKELNKELPAYSQIKRIKIFHEEFEKTPKRSIKRYLYQK